MASPSMMLLAKSAKKAFAEPKEEDSVPVTIKKTASLNAIAMLKMVGVGEVALSWLATSGFVLNLTSLSMTADYPAGHPDMDDDEYLWEIDFPTFGFLSDLKASKADDSDVSMVCLKAVDMIDKLQAIGPVSSGAMALLPPQDLSEQVAGPAPPPAAVGHYDISQMETGSRVKLRDATALYQPVYGSSSGSRYFAVALSDGLNLAARFASHQLSVRAEGSDLKTHKAALQKIGFKNCEEYCSIHLSGVDDLLAKKAMGSLLMAVGADFQTPLPKMQVLKGKGS